VRVYSKSRIGRIVVGFGSTAYGRTCVNVVSYRYDQTDLCATAVGCVAVTPSANQLTN
jgi:hypothetical protein